VCSARGRPIGHSRPRRSPPRRSHDERHGRSRDRPIWSLPTLHLHSVIDAGEPAGQRHRPIRARSSIQASRRGGRTKSTGSQPIDQNGLSVCVLPTKPLSRITRPYGRARTEASPRSFMPRIAAVRECERRQCLALQRGDFPAARPPSSGMNRAHESRRPLAGLGGSARSAALTDRRRVAARPSRWVASLRGRGRTRSASTVGMIRVLLPATAWCVCQRCMARAFSPARAGHARRRRWSPPVLVE